MKTDQKFWLKWMLNYSVGELLGIGTAATIGRLLFIGFSNTSTSENTTSILTLLILIIAGVVEGYIIGYVQWRSLSKVVSGFKLKTWIITTIVSTVAGWLLVLPPAIMFISFLAKFSALNNYYSVLYTSLAGFSFGGLIGLSQFFIIRKYYSNALVWVLATSFSWMISFLFIYKALLLIENSTSLAHNVFLIVATCVCSGLVQGIVTGTSLHFAMPIRVNYQAKKSGQKNNMASIINNSLHNNALTKIKEL